MIIQQQFEVVKLKTKSTRKNDHEKKWKQSSRMSLQMNRNIGPTQKPT